MSSLNSSNGTNATGQNDSYLDIIRSCILFSYFFTIVAAVTMNSIVLLAVYLDKSLHNANKYFVACLAISDFMVAVFSVTIRLHLYMRPNVPLSIHVCRFWIWVDIFTELASITTLTIISIDRYFKVGKPFKYKIMMSTKRCKIIITFLWLYASVVAFLGLVPYQGTKGVHITVIGNCANDNKVFYILAAFIGFFIPVIILIIMCAMMFRIVKRFHRSRSTHNREQSMESPAIPRINVSGKSVANSNHRTVAIFSLVVFAFIVCWGPFFILFLISQYNKDLLSLNDKGFQILSVVCFNILPYTNSFLNPIIYAYFDKSFNMAIKNILLRMMGKQPRSKSLQTMTASRVHLRVYSETGRTSRLRTDESC
ncbi:beta-2 adrenergic receptor-like [Dendronephthya gigantea]|uniref:beta-2 adrenergic receptor-like n=1 Tax=Dendronephthya gigantea TaxID=151771 RepID=UPI00106B0408|nr:beta-2 adrenergic receptor-like [Dendronephthya gigantea]